MNRKVLIPLAAIAAAGAGWFYYQSGQPSESEARLLQSCLISEDMVRLGALSNTGLILTSPDGQRDMCEQHREKLGRRKVKLITGRFRKEQAYQMQYGTPTPAFDPDAAYQVPAPAAAN